MKLTEQLARGFVFSEATVDRETGMIQNVSLLGRVSANGRVYSTKAMGEAAELHKGVAIYVDHPTRSEASDRGGVRSVRDLAGQVISARVVRDRVKGTVQALRGTDPGELLLALAEMPEVAGFSHRATGTTSRDGSGDEVVDSITAVHGADVVSDPATTAGLFESIKNGGKKVTKPPITPAQIVEASQKLAGGNPWGTPKKPVTDDSIREASRNLFV